MAGAYSVAAEKSVCGRPLLHLLRANDEERNGHTILSYDVALRYVVRMYVMLCICLEQMLEN
jgi:hypothetical protein